MPGLKLAFLPPASKLHGLRTLLLNPSSRRPLNSEWHFLLSCPPTLHTYEPRSPRNQASLQSPAFTPKCAARPAIPRGSLAELRQTEAPLQCYNILLNDNSWPFSRRFPAPSKQRKIFQQNVRSPLSKSQRTAMWLKRLESLRWWRYPQHTPGNRADQRNWAQAARDHRKIAPIQANAPRTSGSPVTQT